ncbi:hypothetical protein D0B32_22525 [Paraburkholderia sp. DHOC27]|nr:hypothetical protein D0B32_22525 [Paraburkholderia sp. DHOC27]
MPGSPDCCCGRACIVCLLDRFLVG